MSMYQVVNPATGETVKSYPTASAGDIENAVASAHKAYMNWGRKSTLEERVKLLKTIASMYRERAQTMAKVITREMGKTHAGAMGELAICSDIFDYYADHAAELLADEPIKLLGGEGRALVRKQPIGVLLGIMPWNYPYYQVARFAAPAMMVGNTIVLKHAPQCPESAALIEAMFLEAGYPEGVYNNIYASNEQVADIIADTRVQAVSLTGSERAGAAVAEIAGRNLKKVVLELGGSDPFILMSTDDLDAAVEAAVGARLSNTGQACNAAKRLLVHADLYDAFVEKFNAAVASINPVNPLEDSGAHIGPLSSDLATERLASQVERAVSAGATLVGGKREGNYFKPGLMTGIDKDNIAYREELFGPVASAYKIHSEEEAIALANDTPFGLGSYVYTTDPAQAERMANALEVGMVFINMAGAESAELPFGGVKRSGFGRELGYLGAREFINHKMIRFDK